MKFREIQKCVCGVPLSQADEYLIDRHHPPDLKTHKKQPLFNKTTVLSNKRTWKKTT